LKDQTEEPRAAIGADDVGFNVFQQPMPLMGSVRHAQNLPPHGSTCSLWI
jgi:hypothetical protein